MGMHNSVYILICFFKNYLFLGIKLMVLVTWLYTIMIVTHARDPKQMFHENSGEEKWGG